jgi:hypothetical protein
MNFFMVGKGMNCRQSVFLAMGRRVELWQGKGWAAYRAFFCVGGWPGRAGLQTEHFWAK